LLPFASFAQIEGDTGPLHWYLDLDAKTLTISGDGKMPDYTEDGMPWRDYGPYVINVMMENGVASIGNNAFRYNPGLNSVTLPNSLTSIGSNVFLWCSALSSITLPNSLISIGSYAFSGCNLTSITIPNGVTSIEDNTFKTCQKLTSVTLPNSITSIGSRAFHGCSALTAITLPNNITSIGSEAFRQCNALLSIIIPNSIANIEDGVFSNCNSLTSVTLPNSVTSIGNQSFSGCKALLSITLPNSITSIGVRAFSWCAGLTSITLPNSITKIDTGTFFMCSNFASIIIPSSVTGIGNTAFSNCENLTSITNLNPVPVPIAIDSYIFNGVDQSTCLLTVPTSAVAAYQQAEIWKEFIIEAGGLLVYPKPVDPEQGFVDGNGLYEGGGKSVATVEAFAHKGYKFVNWTKNGVVVSTANPYSFTVTEDVELVANFEESIGIVETLRATSLQVYPNPTTGELRITNYELEITGVEIFDVYGRNLLSHHHIVSSSHHLINISHLPAGIYFVKITTEAGEVIRKVIKN
jgi:hypothetical protein